MSEELEITGRLKAIRQKMEALEREEDVDAAVELLEEAAMEAERLGAELEGEK
ncbi:MAG: hypothetical protein H5T72_08280 [Actinobacteria bacterium]|nr:hypothetical protein [Actinomycetota bacterium]